MKKFIFFTVLAILLILIPVTALKVTPVALVLKNSATLTNYIQRIIGLSAFILLFIQLITGAFMDKITEKLGGWIFNFHVVEGIVIYFLAFLHPLFFMIFNHFIGSGWDPYRVFVNACLLCQTPLEYYYTLGIVSFWLLTVAVFAGLFRHTTPWMKANWRKLHILNYVVFLTIGAHGFLIGTDFRTQPFFSFAVIAYAIVAGIVVFIELPRLYRNYRSWLRS